MTAPLPLFDLPRIRALEEMEAEREKLAQRMQDLPPNSHKRIVLQDRLQRITNRMIKLETEEESHANRT